MIDTLRWRLVAWSLALLTLSLTLFAGLLYVSLSRSLYRHHDDELARDADWLGARIEERLSAAPPRGGPGPYGDPVPDADIVATLDDVRDASGAWHARYVMVRDAAGRLLYRSESLRDLEPTIGQHEVFVHAAERTGAHAQFFDAELASGPTRFICRPVRAGGRELFLQVGVVLGDVRPMLARVRTSSWMLIPLVLLVTSFGGLVIARRALRPMARIQATLQAIQATDLSRRIDVGGTDQELRELVLTLNGLLARLERAFASMREFAGDVSHQLQTPLTVMQGTLTRALQQRDSASTLPSRQADPSTSASTTNSASASVSELASESELTPASSSPPLPESGAHDPLLYGLRDTVHEMIAIVSALQTLSVADLPARRPGDAPVDLSRMCGSVMEAVMALGEAKGVLVEPAIAPGVRAWGDEVRLKQVLLNLGDNAIKFTPAGGRVRIMLAARDGWALLRVEDTGPGVSPEEAPKIFRRCYRGTPAPGGASASGPVPGAGLGLAIARRIVDAHGGMIDVEPAPGTGASFIVRLPLAGGDAGAA